MLINSNGEKKGLVNINDALEAAKNESLDLVQVSRSDSDPVVCKLLDYGKHVFEKKKNGLAHGFASNTLFKPSANPLSSCVSVASAFAFLM